MNSVLSEKRKSIVTRSAQLSLLPPVCILLFGARFLGRGVIGGSIFLVALYVCCFVIILASLYSVLWIKKTALQVLGLVIISFILAITLTMALMKFATGISHGAILIVPAFFLGILIGSFILNTAGLHLVKKN